MFNLAIDSKLRGCNLVNLHVRDVTHDNQALPRAMVVQRKTTRSRSRSRLKSSEVAWRPSATALRYSFFG